MGILDDLQNTVVQGNAINEEIREQKLVERVKNLEVKYRDLENRLRPFLNLIERKT